MSKKGIRISEKHGLNPSLEICFFCGESKGIALMGKLKGDVEAPKQVLLNYEPCDKCKEKFKEGVLVISVVNTPVSEGQFPIQKDLYPNGPHLVIKREAAKRLIPNLKDEQKTMLMEKEVFDNLFKKE